MVQNQIIHCDAGPNVLRSYPVKNNGAGYSAEILDIVHGVNDQWFRPADVCVAPDGSIFVADWYDPGVGGHQARDQTRGRIYRIAPKNHPYKVAKLDISTPELALKGLENPNLETRYLAYRKLQRKTIPCLYLLGPIMSPSWSKTGFPLASNSCFPSFPKLKYNFPSGPTSNLKYLKDIGT